MTVLFPETYAEVEISQSVDNQVVISIPTFGWNGGRDGTTDVYLTPAQALLVAMTIRELAE
jgi:hypothetical protein